MILAYSQQHSLIDTFMRGAAWTAAKRFIYSLPMPVIGVIAAICLMGYMARKLKIRKRVS